MSNDAVLLRTNFAPRKTISATIPFHPPQACSQYHSMPSRDDRTSRADGDGEAQEVFLCNFLFYLLSLVKIFHKI